MYDICCIGHITSDKIITPHSEVNIPGGTAFYFSSALQQMPVRYKLVTAVAEPEIRFVTALREKNIDVLSLPSSHTVCFENIYPDSHNQDHRVQRVTQKADPFSVPQLEGIEAAMYHLGPLLADDMPLELIRYLSSKGKVSLDVQGYLREVKGYEVLPVGWEQKKEALQYIHTIKANESEAEVLTGYKDIYQSAQVLADWGVKEVIITLGSRGSIIFSDKTFYRIPAFKPSLVADATGCGDTYMAGYLYQRSKNKPVQESGVFAAAMATIKIQSSGSFTGTEQEVLDIPLHHIEII